ncbi:hypothetical protein GON26_15600 [Flavobacterium sp. GA093]|uniref:Uncharacterized protein n=1 Tax=Flavobacterium hydrocarbonoxydans TaxID=2683249 RepID=A0A6I4NNS3_9FLAO|nr:hypothetical protein [Flavobacterium hydrocarbonoxydans]MWB95793.1 hypothetical protein [Flavobacterium hydrocarbonoxydans]
MGYMKYTQYVYLVFAAFFIYDGVTKLTQGSNEAWLSLIIAGMAIFMFFFRRRFLKKMEERNKKQ